MRLLYHLENFRHLVHCFNRTIAHLEVRRVLRDHLPQKHRGAWYRFVGKQGSFFGFSGLRIDGNGSPHFQIAVDDVGEKLIGDGRQTLADILRNLQLIQEWTRILAIGVLLHLEQHPAKVECRSRLGPKNDVILQIRVISSDQPHRPWTRDPHGPFARRHWEKQHLGITKSSQSGESAASASSETEHGADGTVRLAAMASLTLLVRLSLARAVRILIFGHGCIGAVDTGQARAGNLRHARYRVPDNGLIHPAEPPAAGADVNRIDCHPCDAMRFEAFSHAQSSIPCFSQPRCHSMAHSRMPSRAASTRCSSAAPETPSRLLNTARANSIHSLSAPSTQLPSALCQAACRSSNSAHVPRKAPRLGVTRSSRVQVSRMRRKSERRQLLASSNRRAVASRKTAVTRLGRTTTPSPARRAVACRYTVPFGCWKSRACRSALSSTWKYG